MKFLLFITLWSASGIISTYYLTKVDGIAFTRGYVLLGSVNGALMIPFALYKALPECFANCDLKRDTLK